MADTATIKVRADTTQAERALGRLQTALGAIVSVGAARAVLDIADSMTSLQNRLRQVSTSQEHTNLLFNELVKVSIAARSPLATTGDLFFRIARSADSLGISQREALTATELVAKAISSSGISAQEAAGPLLQLGQALQSGRLQGDELRSILEGLPPVARAIARSLGVPIAALKDLGSQGKISSKQVIDAILAARDTIEQDFGGTVTTVGQAVTVLGTKFGNLVTNLDQATGTSSAVVGAILRIADSLDSMSKNIDLVVFGLKVLLGVAVGGLIYYFSTPLMVALGVAAHAISRLSFLFAESSVIVTNFVARFVAMSKYIGGLAVRAFNNIIGKTNQLNGVLDFLARLVLQPIKVAFQAAASVLRNFGKEVAVLVGSIVSLGGYVVDFVKKLLGIKEAQKDVKTGPTQAELAAQAELNKKKQKELEYVQGLSKFTKELQDQLKKRQEEINLLTLKDSLTAQEYARQEALIKLNSDAQAKGFLNKEVRNLNEKLAALAQEAVRLEEIATRYKEINDLGTATLSDVMKSADARIGAEQDYINKRIALENYYTQNTSITEEQFQKALGQLENDRLTATQAAETANFNKRIEQMKQDMEYGFFVTNQKMMYDAEYYNQRVANEQNYQKLVQTMNERRFREMGFTTDQAKSMAQERADFDKKSEAEKAQFAIQQAASIFDDLGKRNRAAFEAAKAFNIANAIMNTYAGATKALAIYPPPFNFLAAAGVVAAGLAQVASIRAQTYSGRALGGPIVGGQQYIVGERGPELITAPSGGASVTPNNQLGGVTNITFNIQATDARGFDQLLTQRKGMIINMIKSAQADRGRVPSV